MQNGNDARIDNGFLKVPFSRIQSICCTNREAETTWNSINN